MKSPLLSSLRALEEARVRYLIVGGVAVVLHGHLRTTTDLDLIVELEATNLQAALDAMIRQGLEPVAPVPLMAFADPESRKSWVRDKNMVVFSLWHPDDPLFKLDLFVEEPLDFQEAWARRIRANIGGLEVSVAHLEDLIALKRKAGRPQDLADIDALGRLEET